MSPIQSTIKFQLIKIRRLIKRSYFCINITDQNATIVILPLFGLQVQRHRHRVRSVAKCHAMRIPEVARMNGTWEGRGEQHSNIHCARFAGGCDMRCKFHGLIIIVVVCRQQLGSGGRHLDQEKERWEGRNSLVALFNGHRLIDPFHRNRIHSIDRTILLRDNQFIE